MSRNIVTSLFGLVFAALSGCGMSTQSEEHGGAEAAAEEMERGPHGGRMLRGGDFALELWIFEQGVPPEYHAYGYMDDKPLAPGEFTARVTLSRLGGRTDRFEFAPSGNFLRGNGVVREPHSFDVKVEAQHAGQQHAWQFASYEGRTQIAPEIAEASGMKIEPAGPAILRETIELTGAIHARADRQAAVHARFPGVLREARANIGDRVARGAVLARVQSNESLETYSVSSPIAGVVLERAAQVGEVTSSGPLFVVADL